MNPKIAEAHHRDPYLHELAITVIIIHKLN